jgi:hypothetical protein
LCVTLKDLFVVGHFLFPTSDAISPVAFFTIF